MRTCPEHELLYNLGLDCLTLNPFWISQKQTFDRFVDLPTPLTPTKVMVYGARFALADELAAGAFARFARIDRSRSVDVFGVRMRVSAADSAFCTSAFTAAQTVSASEHTCGETHS